MAGPWDISSTLPYNEALRKKRELEEAQNSSEFLADTPASTLPNLGMGDMKVADPANRAAPTPAESSGLARLFAMMGSKKVQDAPRPLSPEEPVDLASLDNNHNQPQGDNVDPSAPRSATPRAPLSQQPAPSPSSEATPADAPSTDQVSIRDYLKKKYGLDESTNQDALKNAQQYQRDMAQYSMMQGGLDKIGTAFSRGTVKPDQHFTDALAARGTQAVKDVEQLRAGKKDELGLDTGISDFAKKEEARDPASQESAAMREFYTKNFPEFVKNMPNFQFLSADDIKENVGKPIELKQKSDDNKLKAQMLNQQRTQANQDRNDLRQQAIDQRSHENILRQVKTNPQLRSRLQQAQNLENSASLIENANNVTPQQILEFQQSVRSNLGIKGTSGVDERSATYFRSMGWSLADAQQFLFGDPAQLSKNDPLLQHIKQLATIEHGNARKQYQQSLAAMTAGNPALYQRRPDLKQGLDELTSASMNQVSPTLVTPSNALDEKIKRARDAGYSEEEIKAHIAKQ